MNICVFDIEANGLENVTKIFCCVIKDIKTSIIYKYYNHNLSELKSKFEEFDVVIGHNIIKYDNELLTQFYGIDFSKRIIIDTLVWSQVLNLDRQLPKGCPTVIPNPITGLNDKVGPHSLAAWGYRVGRYKPSHFDWTKFSMEMLHRCTEDVEIQELVLYELLKEADLTLEEFIQK